MGPRLMCGVKPDDDNTFPNLQVKRIYRIRNLILGHHKEELDPLSQRHSSSPSPLGYQYSQNLEVKFLDRVRNPILGDHKEELDLLSQRHPSSHSPLGYQYKRNIFRKSLFQHSYKPLTHQRQNPFSMFLPAVQCSDANQGPPAAHQPLHFPFLQRVEMEPNLQFISRSVPVLSAEELTGLEVMMDLRPGSYAEVHKVIYKGSSAIRKVMSSGSLLGLTLREARVLLELDGAGGAPRVLAVCTDPPAIVMEYVGGTLRDFLHECRDVPLILETVARVCDRVQEIHTKGFVHCDLKANNITLTGELQDPDVHVIDFGLTTTIGREFDAKIAGIDFDDNPKYLRLWMSPEMKTGLPLHPSSDVYSLGVLMVRIMVIAKDSRLAYKLTPLLLACTHPNPDKRPHVPHIAEYLRDLKCKVEHTQSSHHTADISRILDDILYLKSW